MPAIVKVVTVSVSRCRRRFLLFQETLRAFNTNSQSDARPGVKNTPVSSSGLCSSSMVHLIQINMMLLRLNYPVHSHPDNLTSVQSYRFDLLD